MSRKHRRPLLSQGANRPPIGGWGVEIKVGDETFRFLDGTPYQIVEKIFELTSKNGVHETIDETWAYCNEVWCNREPSRCKGIRFSKKISKWKSQPEPAEEKSSYGNRHMVVTPKAFGYRLWEMLNTFGMRGGFVKSEWTMTIGRVSRFLDPAQNPATGCVECHSTWQRMIKEQTPNAVANSEQAARWVFWAHNKVNKKLGKKIEDWATMVERNHWDVKL